MKELNHIIVIKLKCNIKVYKTKDRMVIMTSEASEIG